MTREKIDEISDDDADDGPEYVAPAYSAAARAESDAREWERACRVLDGCTSSAEAAMRAAETAMDGRMYRRWCAENLRPFG